MTYIVGVFPHDISRSSEKLAANETVLHSLNNQGLAAASDAVVLVLDTSELLTTRLLLRSPGRRVVIVERGVAEYRAILRAIKKLPRAHAVTVINMDVFEFLRTRPRVDFMWLDLMTKRLKDSDYDAIKAVAAVAVAITISARGSRGDTVKRRVAEMGKALAEQLPYKTLDYGYTATRNRIRGQPMHVATFGRTGTVCLYRPRFACQSPMGTLVAWAGYPGYTTVEPGTAADWKKKCDTGLAAAPTPIGASTIGASTTPICASTTTIGVSAPRISYQSVVPIQTIVPIQETKPSLAVSRRMPPSIRRSYRIADIVLGLARPRHRRRRHGQW